MGMQKDGGGMQDEYGEDMDKGSVVARFERFRLESGLTLPEVTVAYQTWGSLDAAGGNCVFVAHALTGNADAASWWGGIIGPGCPLDTDRYLVVCANMLGSCYGTTGPLSEMPSGCPWVAPRPEGTHLAAAGGRFAADFPYCTLRDTVRLHRALLERLGVTAVHAVVGGSAGGMQALEWALLFPDLVQRAVVIACGATQSAWQVAISEAQRQAIYHDPQWNGGYYSLDCPPSRGLAVARQEAMIWYRSREAYDTKFGRGARGGRVGAASAPNLRAVHEEGRSGGALPPANGIAAAHGSAGEEGRGSTPLPSYAVEGYLEYQGAKFVDRFDAGAYVALTRSLDSHDVGRERGGVEAALASIEQPVLVVGITSDVLYPLAMQQELAQGIPRAALRVVTSGEGHDGFLLEVDQVGAHIREGLAMDPGGAAPPKRLLNALLQGGDADVTPQLLLSSPAAMRQAMLRTRPSSGLRPPGGVARPPNEEDPAQGGAPDGNDGGGSLGSVAW